MQEKSVKKIILIAFIAFLIIIGTVFLSTSQTVHNKEEMKSIKAGYPIAFVTQDFSRYDPPFPWQYRFGSGGMFEDPVRILWLRFVLSYGIIFSVVAGL